MSVRSGFGAAVALLAGVNLATALLPGWTYLPVNLGVLVVLVVVARRAGATDADLGLRRDRARSSLRLGLGLAAGFAALIAAAALIPATRGWFDDERAAGIGVAGLLYQVALRIPIGTALFEEFAFRGVLLGLGRKAWGQAKGGLASAALFGMWHAAPALDVARTNATAAGVSLPLVMAAAVVGTTVAGLVFNRILDRGEGLAAPVVVHAVVNAAAFGAAWVLR